MMEFLRAISFFASVGAVAAFLFLLVRPFFSPSGWTKKENDGVAVRFKVFLPLYLQNPEKWKLMPDAARYENMMVYFSTGRQWRKYNRWRKRVRKQRQKAEREERQRKFMEAIFKEYEPKPNPEFIPPPTVKPKQTAKNGEDCFIVNGGVGNPIVAVIPKPKDGLTNAELEKIRADLMLTAQAQEKQINPRCKDCVHMKYMQRTNSEKFDTVCVRHITKLGLEHVWPEMTACGTFEPKTQPPPWKRPEPLGTVTTH